MDSKRLSAFRDELHKIQAKSNNQRHDQDTILNVDDVVNTHVGLSLFNQTAALGQLSPTWTVDVQLRPEHKTTYAALLANKWDIASPNLEDLFVGRLCYRLATEDGALRCENNSEESYEQYSNHTDENSAIIFWIADEAHRRLRGMGVPGLGRCAAVRYPLCATLPGTIPQKVRGTCHAVFWHGNNVTLVDFHCRRLALPATSDVLRLSLYKALGLRIGLTTPDQLRVATLIAYLDQERPRLRFWSYTLSKQMDEAVMSLDCMAQVIKLLQLHVTEVIT